MFSLYSGNFTLNSLLQEEQKRRPAGIREFRVGSGRKQTMMSPKIRTCTKEDAQVLAETVRMSFLDVAERFALTQENAPRHSSNCTEDWIQKDRDRGIA